MPTAERDRPVVTLLRSVVWTVQLAALAGLALGPLVAGFVVPLGPPQYSAHVADVSPASEARADATAYSELSADGRAAFSALLEADGDAIARQVRSPPAVLAPGELVVVQDGHAFRVVASRSRPPLRPVAILAGFLGSVLGTLVGAAVFSLDLA